MKKFLIATILSLAVVVPVMAVSDTKKEVVFSNCNETKERLKEVQRDDSKTREHLGKYYEAILKNFVIPLNVRLVEDNLSSADLVENQNKIADTKKLFGEDFINYQQNLEELIRMDCENEPVRFYEQLDIVRQKRKIMEQDVLKMRSLISKHVELVEDLKGEL